MIQERQFSPAEARMIGDAIGVNWNRVDLEQFRMGLAVELEHGAWDPQTDVTADDLILTGKIALAHLNELPDYYTRLARMESGAQFRPMTTPSSTVQPGMYRDFPGETGQHEHLLDLPCDAMGSDAVPLFGLDFRDRSFWTGALMATGMVVLAKWVFAKS